MDSIYLVTTPEHLIIPYAGEGLFAVRVSSRSRRVRSTVLVLLRRHCYCVARVHTEGPCAAGRWEPNLEWFTASANMAFPAFWKGSWCPCVVRTLE